METKTKITHSIDWIRLTVTFPDSSKFNYLINRTNGGCPSIKAKEGVFSAEEIPNVRPALKYLIAFSRKTDLNNGDFLSLLEVEAKKSKTFLGFIGKLKERELVKA